MPLADIFYNADQFLTGIFQSSNIIQNFGPYAIGISATAIGIFLGTFYSDDSSLLEFQKHVEKESYFKEMKTFFLKKDHFFNILRWSITGFAISFILLTIFVIYLAYDLFKLKRYILTYMTQNSKRVDDMECVIESVLKDNEITDFKRLEICKEEFKEQKKSFQEFLQNTSMEFEIAKQDCQNICNKAKKVAQSYTKKISDIFINFDSLKLEVSSLFEKIEDVSQKSNTLGNDLEKISSDVFEKAEIIKKNSNKIFEDLNTQLNSEMLDISKCNALLICSKSLFEASIEKFNEINLKLKDDSIIDEKELDSNEEVSSISSVLNKAIEISKFLNSNLNENMENEKKLYDQYPGNALLITLMERLSSIEVEMFNQNSLITSNDTSIKKLEKNTMEKISNLKFDNDKWVTSWVSVMYGIFNSSFLHLENELFGIDSLEYQTIFEGSDDIIKENSKVMYDIMELCKKSCISIIKEVNLLIFEYYLIKQSFSGSKASIILICNDKIDKELNLMCLKIEKNIDHLSLDVDKKDGILGRLRNLINELSIDLKNDTLNFNTLVKNNLDDFCIMHETMKSLSTHIKQEDNFSSADDDSDIDSIIEINAHSTFNSSCSENENSFSGNNSYSSLKPFKLSVNKAKK